MALGTGFPPAGAPAGPDASRGGGRVVEGDLNGQGRRVAVVVARFNELFTRQLLEGAVRTLRQHGVAPGQVDTLWVPGAFELPLAAKACAETGRYDAVIALGCVIRGATPHFDYVCAQAAAGINRAGLDTGVPVAFGVITADTLEQAAERSGTKAGNKGAEAALAALEMASLLEKIKEG